MRDLRNRVFGYLTVINYVGRKNKKHFLWRCKCVCGKEKIVYETNLISGKSTSCGCKRVEVGKKNYKYIRLSTRKYATPMLATAAQVWRQSYRDGLTFEEFLNLSQKNCHYCGDPPNNKTKLHASKTYKGEWAKGATFIYNGLDRLDNNKGHSLDNVVPCCAPCNRAKLKRSYDEFVEWVEKVYNHHVKNRNIEKSDIENISSE